MNTRQLSTLTLMGAAAALCAAGSAHAVVLNFNNPALVTIDASNVATYTESGYTISGPAASFLPLNDALVGGFDSTPFSLKAVGGAAFTLQSLDAAFFDLGFGNGSGNVTLAGLVGAAQVASQTLTVTGPGARFAFGSAWRNLTEVRFAGNTGFALDNISAVPEPGRWALAALGLAGLFMYVRRQRALA